MSLALSFIVDPVITRDLGLHRPALIAPPPPSAAVRLLRLVFRWLTLESQSDAHFMAFLLYGDCYEKYWDQMNRGRGEDEGGGAQGGAAWWEDWKSNSGEDTICPGHKNSPMKKPHLWLLMNLFMFYLILLWVITAAEVTTVYVTSVFLQYIFL